MYTSHILQATLTVTLTLHTRSKYATISELTVDSNGHDALLSLLPQVA